MLHAKVLCQVSLDFFSTEESPEALRLRDRMDVLPPTELCRYCTA